MLGVPLDKRARRVLTVTVDAGLALTLDETPSRFVPMHVAEPQADNSLFDGSPRTSRSVWRLYWQGTLLNLGPCDRVEVHGGETFELIAVPKPVMNGRVVVGYSAPALPVSVLYPRTAELRALGSEEAIATVECAVYSARESNGQRGTFHDTFCEMPPAAWPHITPKANQVLAFSDGLVWTLNEASLSAEVPFVSASIRKPG